MNALAALVADPLPRVPPAIRWPYDDGWERARGGLDGILPPRPRARTPSGNRRKGGRERELAWKALNQGLLRTLANEWVVLEGEQLVGHGPDPVPLVEAARRRGIASPYVFFVEPDDGAAAFGL